MKLSTRSRYGLKAIIELAVAYGQGPVTVAALAEKQKISAAYLEQLVALLRANSLVTSTRGAAGGYMLAKDPQEITAQEILETLEGNLILMDCATETKQCDHKEECLARPLWQRMQTAMEDVLKNTTLKDLADDMIREKTKKDDILFG